MKFPGGSWKNLCPTPLKVYPRISWKNFPAICVYLRFFFCTFLSGLSWFPRVHVASLPKGFLGESSQPAAFSSQSAAPSWAAPPSRGVAGFTFRNEKIFSTKQKKFLKEAVKKWPKNNIFWVVFGGFASKFWPKTCRGLLPACWTPTPGPLPPHLFQPAPLFPADLWDIPLGWGGSWSWSWRGIPWWPAAFLNSQDLETKMNGWRPYRNYSVEPTLKPSIGSVFEKPFRRWRCGAQFTDILVSFAFLSLQVLCCYFAIFEFFMDFCFFFCAISPRFWVILKSKNLECTFPFSHTILFLCKCKLGALICCDAFPPSWWIWLGMHKLFYTFAAWLSMGVLLSDFRQLNYNPTTSPALWHGAVEVRRASLCLQWVVWFLSAQIPIGMGPSFFHSWTF